MSIIKAILGMLALVFGGGCAAVSSLPISSILPPTSSAMQSESLTSVKLAEGNFVLVKTNVVGRSKGFALLGLIPLVTASSGKAMDRLYAQAEFEVGRPQTLAHIVTDRSGSYFILFSLPQVNIRADVVEFRPSFPVGPSTNDLKHAGQPRTVR
jgi:hypothetical protein